MSNYNSNLFKETLLENNLGYKLLECSSVDFRKSYT